MARDYYEILGVQKTASFEEIKHAFRSRAKDCHPDYHPDDPDAEKKFKELNEAYDVLKDNQKRAAYDQYGPDAFQNAGGFGQQGFGGFDFSGTGFESIFEDIFSGLGGARSARQNNVGIDLRYDLAISLEEAYTGLKKKIKVEADAPCEACGGKGGKKLETCATCQGAGRIRQRQGFFVVENVCPTCNGTGKTVKDPCDKCHGTGRTRQKKELEVNIPAGVDTGVRMRLSGEGSMGAPGSKRGDLYVFLTVKEHELFSRQGAHLACAMPIPMTLAAMGGKIQVPTIDGSGAEVTIKPGTQTGAQIKIKGKGMPVLKSDSFGDLYVTFTVETPTNLTSRQKELLKEFEAAGSDNQSACADFLKKVKKIWANF